MNASFCCVTTSTAPGERLFWLNYSVQRWGTISFFSENKEQCIRWNLFSLSRLKGHSAALFAKVFLLISAKGQNIVMSTLCPKWAYTTSQKHDSLLIAVQERIKGLFVLDQRKCFSRMGAEVSKYQRAAPDCVSNIHTQSSTVKANHIARTTQRSLMQQGFLYKHCTKHISVQHLHRANCTSLSTLHILSVQWYVFAFL